MATKITVQIRASREGGSPTIADLLDQVRDYFDILENVEEAVSGNGTTALEWRVVSATTNSPITLEAMAFARDYGVNIDRRAADVTREVATGLKALSLGSSRPHFFDDRTIAKAERIFERVTNGLAQTFINHGPDLPALELTPPVARAAMGFAKAALTPPEQPYTELGSIEGAARTIDQDGHGRLILRVQERLTGEDVKCIVTGKARDELGEHQVRDIWHNRRVRVYGTLRFKGRGRLQQVDATMVRFLRDRSDFPDVADILDPDFTGGLSSEEYLERIRDGRLS